MAVVLNSGVKSFESAFVDFPDRNKFYKNSFSNSEQYIFVSTKEDNYFSNANFVNILINSSIEKFADWNLRKLVAAAKMFQEDHF